MQNRVMDAMISCFGNDVRRINHALKVHAFAMLIACREEENLRAREIIGVTALLHDIGIPEAERKYNSSSGTHQQIEGPPIARKILTDMDISADIIERVCFIIGNHHTYPKIDGLDFQIVVEADLLVNIYEDEMKRDAVESLGEKIVKTTTGKSLLERMYLK
ncbi:MAG: HD domain-containing protein [Methanomicrobiales archaeon]|nr:HD domain-containing protein [Methanomicrobiales archaeon]